MRRSLKIFTEKTKKWLSMLEPFKRDCIAETKVNPEYPDRIVLHGEYPEDRKLKCYVKCMSMKMGVLDANGEVVEEIFRKYLNVDDDEIAKSVSKKCLNENSTDLCEKAFRISKCSYKAAQELLIQQS